VWDPGRERVRRVVPQTAVRPAPPTADGCHQARQREQPRNPGGRHLLREAYQLPTARSGPHGSVAAAGIARRRGSAGPPRDRAAPVRPLSESRSSVRIAYFRRPARCSRVLQPALSHAQPIPVPGSPCRSALAPGENLVFGVRLPAFWDNPDPAGLPSSCGPCGYALIGATVALLATICGRVDDNDMRCPGRGPRQPEAAPAASPFVTSCFANA